MADIANRIQQLRDKMTSLGLDAYIIPSSDPHLSEYVAPRWEGRKWASGFTGSAGTLVLTRKESGLWTDGRYHIQAENQLQGSGIRLFKAGLEGVKSYPDWLADSLDEGNVVGLFGQLFSVSDIKKLEEKLARKGIKLNKEHDLLEGIWADRPDIPLNPVYSHDVVYAGKSTAEKINEIRREMNKKGVNYYLVPSLDDVAWLFNVRGSDVEYNPIVISYGLLSQDRAWLFIDPRKLNEEVKETLQNNGVTIEGYEQIRDRLAQLGEGDSILYDPRQTNYWLYDAINPKCKKVEDMSLCALAKAVKNTREIRGIRECHVRDGVAMVKFLYWLDQNLGKQEITELTVAEKLEYFRSQQKDFVGPSFATIAAYKDNAAMMHYQATEESHYVLEKEGMLLIDSGGQYLDGTTDITRTIILGPISDEERRDYTLTLKGNINLSRAKFLSGATGSNLDILARLPLWEYGIDYKCGTGHGVGYFLSVHEGPQRMSQVPNNIKLREGMVITNEPGVYREGKYGIRIENELLVVEDQKTESGQFLKFDVLTLCPIDLEGVDVQLLSLEEKHWLNGYHKLVYEKLSPYLTDEEREWLKQETRAI